MNGRDVRKDGTGSSSTVTLSAKQAVIENGQMGEWLLNFKKRKEKKERQTNWLQLPFLSKSLAEHKRSKDAVKATVEAECRRWALVMWCKAQLGVSSKQIYIESYCICTTNP